MDPEAKKVKLPNGPQYELRRQYYDLASIGMNRSRHGRLAQAGAEFAIALRLGRTVQFNRADGGCVAEDRFFGRGTHGHATRQCGAPHPSAANMTDGSEDAHE